MFTITSLSDLENLFITNKIKQIYHGKDNCCRCGCGGKYYTPSDKFFKIMFKRAKETYVKFHEYQDKYHNLDYSKRFDVYPSNDNNEGYINIPVVNADNKCYCVYFK